MITGMGRSGGSLLARLLDGHPAIASYPYEPRFGKIDPYKHGKLSESFPDPLVGSIEDVLRHNRRLERSLAIVSGASPSKTAYPDYDEEYFRRALHRPLPADAGPGDFIEAFSEAFFRSHDFYRDRWDEIGVIAWHSAKGQLWSEEILRIDGLQLIYIIRHPLDVLASYLRSKGRKVPVIPEIELLWWCDCLLRAARDQLRAPDRVSVVRYEDIVSDVDGFARRLASSLAVSDSSELRRPSLFGQDWAGNSSYQKYQAVSTDSIGRFDGYFSAEQIARCAEILDGWLEPMGYRLVRPYFGAHFSLQQIAAAKDSFQVSRDILLYYESRCKNRARAGDLAAFWPDPYHAKQQAGVSVSLKKKARSLLASAGPKGQKP